MQAIGWTDYICPWCWLGRDRTELMRSLGVVVEMRPFELHPELPPDGHAVRPGGRLDHVLDVIGAECAELGIDFTKPTRTPNSRRALETAEVVRLHFPDHFEALDESLYRAHWVDGLDIGDRAVLDDAVARSGADPREVFELVADGIGYDGVRRSMEEARDHGVVSTPSWWVGDALLIPGAQPRSSIERWITKMQAKATAAATRDAPDTVGADPALDGSTDDAACAVPAPGEAAPADSC